MNSPALAPAQLRRFWRDVLRRLDVDPPLAPSDLCARLGAQRNRPLVLVGRAVPAGAALGALVCFPAKDLILYQSATSPAHQAHIIYHELAHLVRGHTADGDSAVCGLLLQDPSPAPGAGLYDHWQEREAETSATLLSAWAITPAPLAGSDRSDATARRLGAALGGAAAW